MYWNKDEEIQEAKECGCGLTIANSFILKEYQPILSFMLRKNRIEEYWSLKNDLYIYHTYKGVRKSCLKRTRQIINAGLLGLSDEYPNIYYNFLKDFFKNNEEIFELHANLKFWFEDNLK